jgi:hypothetical protein
LSGCAAPVDGGPRGGACLKHNMEIAMGLRLLLVEDESLIAMMVEDMAEELGHGLLVA